MLELAAPLGSGADTIKLVAGTFDGHGFPGSVLTHGGVTAELELVAGSITTIPEPQTTTAIALGLPLLICLHMMVRRRGSDLRVTQ